MARIGVLRAVNSVGLAKSAGIVAAWTILSKILGFLREAVLASRFGASSSTDAYLMAMVIPSLLMLGIGPAVSATVIPVFAGIEKKNGRAAAFTAVNSIATACLLLAVGGTTAGLFAARTIVRALAPGFAGETFELTVRLTRILLPIAILTTLSSVFAGLLQSVGKFGATAFEGIAQNTILISFIAFLGPRYGITGVAIGGLLGALSMLLVKIPALAASGYKYRPSLDWHNEGLKQAGRLIGPIIAGSAAAQAGATLTRVLASTLPEGSITFINYAQRLAALPSGIFGTALVTVLYPTLAKMYSTRPEGEFALTFEKSIGVVLFMLTPMAVGIMALATPIVQLAFERGAFTSEATGATAAALFYSAIAVPATSLSLLASRAFYASKDTITPVLVNVGAIGVVIAFKLLLVGKMGHSGIALAGACQPIASFLILYIVFKRRLGWKATRGTPSASGINPISSFAKCMVSSLLMWVVVVASCPRVADMAPGMGTVQQAIRLGVSVALGALVYVGTAALVKSEELKFLLGALRKRSIERVEERVGRRP
jgi:putative peptidoglycan lipid II flippase